MSEQLLLVEACRHCGAASVAHSIVGDWHVCKRCNAIEWGKRLASNPDPFYANLGRQIACAQGVKV